MAIGILPPSKPRKRFTRIADFPAEQTIWPLGQPDGIERVGDLTDRDHLLITISSRTLFADYRDLSCRVSAMICEPPVVQARFYRLLPWIGGAFHRVLTHNSRLLKRLPNTRFLPHGGQFVRRVPEIDRPKRELISLIASKKRNAPGHRLRHRVAAWSRDAAPHLALLGGGYEPLDDKAEGHTPYYFSAVLENSREPGYFTEKLLDSLLCMCLPVYWGAPDIEHFFDPRGMIVCRTEAEVREAILTCNEADYQARRPYLIENRRRAIEYADRHRNAALLLAREDQFRPGQARASIERDAA